VILIGASTAYDTRHFGWQAIQQTRLGEEHYRNRVATLLSPAFSATLRPSVPSIRCLVTTAIFLNHQFFLICRAGPADRGGRAYVSHCRPGNVLAGPAKYDL